MPPAPARPRPAKTSASTTSRRSRTTCSAPWRGSCRHATRLLSPSSTAKRGSARRRCRASTSRAIESSSTARSPSRPTGETTIGTAVTDQGALRYIAIPVTMEGDTQSGIYVRAIDLGAELSPVTAAIATYSIAAIAVVGRDRDRRLVRRGSAALADPRSARGSGRDHARRHVAATGPAGQRRHLGSDPHGQLDARPPGGIGRRAAPAPGRRAARAEDPHHDRARSPRDDGPRGCRRCRPRRGRSASPSSTG